MMIAVVIASRALLPVGLSAEEPREVLLADGRRLAALDLAFGSDGRAQISTREGTVAAPLESLVEVRFHRAEVLPPPAGEPAVLHLHDGSFLPGAVKGGGEADVKLGLAGGLEIPFSVDAVRALCLGPRASRQDVRRILAESGSDVIYRRAEKGGDFTTGTLVAFEKGGVKFEYRLGETLFPWDDIEALGLSQQLEPEAASQARRVQVDLRPDGMLSGTFQGMGADGLELIPLFGEQSIKIPAYLIHGLRFPGPHHRWLSDLATSAAEELPYLGGPEVFLYPHRRDRSVSGRPLQVSGRRHAKGFGCHSYTRLEFDLSDLGALRLLAEVGVAEEVAELAHEGSVVFRVELDGREVFRSPARRVREEAVAVAVDLEGARKLALITDFGEQADIADRGVWGSALLLLAAP